MADFPKFQLAVTLLAVLMASTLLAPVADAQSAADTLAVVGHAPPPWRMLPQPWQARADSPLTITGS